MQQQAIRSLIANHLAVPMDAVRDNAGFATDLGADSLDMIELAMRFEEELDISIGDEEGEACETEPQGPVEDWLRAPVVAITGTMIDSCPWKPPAKVAWRQTQRAGRRERWIRRPAFMY